MVGEEEKAYEHGCKGCISKPIDEEELWARIGSMLRIARLEQENLSLRQEIEGRVRTSKAPGMGRWGLVQRIKTYGIKV